MATSKWTVPMAQSLLNKYYKHQFLYCPDLQDFKNPRKRNSALQNIKKKLLEEFPDSNITLEDIKNKLEFLKTQYNTAKQHNAYKRTLEWCNNQIYCMWGFNINEVVAKIPVITKAKVMLAEKRCRICLMMSANWLPVHCKIYMHNEHIIVSGLLSTIANIKIEPGDKKPGEICRTCMDVAKIAYEFKITCEESDGILTKELMNVKEIDSIDLTDIKEETSEIDSIDLTDIKEECIEETSETIEENLLQNIAENSSTSSLTNIKEKCIEETSETIEEHLLQNVAENSSIELVNEVTVCKTENDEQHSANLIEEEIDIKEELYEDEISDAIHDDLFQDIQNNDGAMFVSINNEIQTNDANIGDAINNSSIDMKDGDEEMDDTESVDDPTENTDETEDTLLKPHSCTQCHKSFANKTQLTAHVRRHNNPRKKKITTKCPHCDFIPENSRKLATHTAREHMDKKKLVCSVCDKKFMTKRHLRIHQTVHSEKTHVCEYCGNKFASSGNLKLHILTHTGEKPHECKICGKRFTQLTGLYVHKVYLHSDKRDFECQECGIKFKHAGGLKKHLITHTDIWPFKCTVCDTKTRDLSGLRMHMKIHNKQYNYECDVCDKMFIKKSGLTQHMIKHTKDKPHVCDICGNRFTQSQSLRSHMATQHKDVVKNNNDKVEQISDNEDSNTSDDSASSNSDCLLSELLINEPGTSMKKENDRTRRGGRGKDMCFFCKKLVLNFARHLKRNHSSETEVENIFSLPVGSKERKKLFTSLRKKGNYLNSHKVRKPMKQSKSNAEVFPCTTCLGFYSAKLLRRHNKTCGTNNSRRPQADS